MSEVVEKDNESWLYENNFLEGGKTTGYVSRYERNKTLRQEAVLFHGTTCEICGFDFGKVYGALGKDFIEIHHKRPISTLDKKERVDPVMDMIPVCANCHRIIHRNPKNVLTPEDLKDAINANKR